MAINLAALNDSVKASSGWVSLLRSEMGKVIIGQQYLIDRLLIGLLANGHVLLEGVPGLAKTLSVRTLASIIEADFSRIQFTPDLLPADILGTLIYANLVLADEINRAPAKVQSALLEAMQERQVTIGEHTFPLPEPFLVLATENPIDQEGTYTLPEAQIDRFMLKLKIGYPTRQEERQILETMATTRQKTDVNTIINPKDILAARDVIDQLYIDDKVKDYIVDIVLATRQPSKYKIDLDAYVRFGGSPRATIALTLAAKAWAYLQGRGYVTPQDVKTIGMDVLRHRVIVTYEAEAEDLTSEHVVKRIFDTLPVP
jgi:MoxR-like ATPase